MRELIQFCGMGPLAVEESACCEPPREHHGGFQYGLFLGVVAVHAALFVPMWSYTEKATGAGEPRVLQVHWLNLASQPSPIAEPPVETSPAEAMRKSVIAEQTNDSAPVVPPSPLLPKRRQAVKTKRESPPKRKAAQMSPAKPVATAPFSENHASSPRTPAGTSTENLSFLSAEREVQETPPSYHADYLSNPAPAYPSASRRLGEEGTVRLRVRVDPAGLATEIVLARSSGYIRLDRAAREAVSEWRFVPARQGEQQVAGWVVVPVSFTLRRDS
jgi:periplasmic protein TonB